MKNENETIQQTETAANSGDQITKTAAPRPRAKRRYESGHAKTLESFARLIAAGARLDQTRLDPPAELAIRALEAAHAEAAILQTAVGNARADFRTAALARQLEVGKFDALAAQAVGQLSGRGAARETIEDARGYVRKLRGQRAKPKAEQDPASPNFNPNVKNISASQRSNAVMIQTFLELLDFLEAQDVYAAVRQSGLLVPDLRAVVATAQTKHAVSIESAAALAVDRNERNKRFYLDPDNLCDLAGRYKELVKGAYGPQSPEFKTIKAIHFKKRTD